MVLILEYLHLQGLAHRDFKPENMVISQSKHLQLIDFGTLNDFCESILPENLKPDVKKKNETKIEILKKKGILVIDQDQEQINNQSDLINQYQQQFQPQQIQLQQIQIKDQGIFRYDDEQVDRLQKQESFNEFDQNNLHNLIASPLPVSRKRLTTFCGTNDYLSPEMLSEQKCDMNGDLWALGCIIYQMFLEKTPFHQKQISYDALKNRILNCDYQINENIPDVAKDIIKRLLVLQPDQRLGGVKVTDQLQKSDIEKSYKELKSHAFFEGIDWNNLYNQPYTEEHEIHSSSNIQEQNHHFIRRPIKKYTAPPLQNSQSFTQPSSNNDSNSKNLNYYASQIQQEQPSVATTQQINSKKKKSEDLYDIQKNTLSNEEYESSQQSMKDYFYAKSQQNQSKQIDNIMNSNPDNNSNSNSSSSQQGQIDLMYESTLFEKQWKVLKVATVIQVTQDQLFLIVSGLDYQKKLTKYKLYIDQHTKIEFKKQKLVINNNKTKKSYVDYRDNKVSDLYQFLIDSVQNKFNKKSN